MATTHRAGAIAKCRAPKTAAARLESGKTAAPKCVCGGYASEERKRIVAIETSSVYLVIYSSVIKPNSFAFSGKRDSWHFQKVGNSTVKKLGFDGKALTNM
jgi:hypothetical protein